MYPEQPYTRFEDEKTTETPLSTQQQQDNKKPQGYRPLKRSAFMGVTAAFLGVTFGLARIIAVSQSDYGDLGKLEKQYLRKLRYGSSSSLYGLEIWGPIVGIIASGFGLDALRYSNYGGSGLSKSHMILCLISCVTAFTLVIAGGVVAGVDGSLLGKVADLEEVAADVDRLVLSLENIPDTPVTVEPKLLKEPFLADIRTVMAFEILIVLAAILTILTNIASSTLILLYFCRKPSNSDADAVVETTGEYAHANAPLDAVALPLGMQLENPPTITQTTLQFHQETLFAAP